MSEPLVHLEIREGAAVITLDSPANRNALSTQLVTELLAALAAAAADPAARAVVLTHTGNTFCAGADLSDASGTPDSRTQQMVDLMRALLVLPKPVIAEINGHVRAGGFGILGACDFVYAGPATTFAVSEVRIGVAAAMISLVVLPHLRTRDAAQIFLTGDKFDAAYAAELGIVTAAVDDPHTATATLLSSLRQCSPASLRETRALLWQPVLADLDARAPELAALSARLFAGDDAREGITAFFAKRPPRWATE